jgi:hypothetical protein
LILPAPAAWFVSNAGRSSGNRYSSNSSHRDGLARFVDGEQGRGWNLLAGRMLRARIDELCSVEMLLRCRWAIVNELSAANVDLWLEKRGVGRCDRD